MRTSDRGLWDLTQLECNRRGWQVEETSGWWADRKGQRRRWDLFGFIDCVAWPGTADTVAIQFTSASNMAARVRKCMESPLAPMVVGMGWHVLVWGWRDDGTLRQSEIRSDGERLLVTGDCVV